MMMHGDDGALTKIPQHLILAPCSSVLWKLFVLPLLLYNSPPGEFNDSRISRSWCVGLHWRRVTSILCSFHADVVTPPLFHLALSLFRTWSLPCSCQTLLLTSWQCASYKSRWTLTNAQSGTRKLTLRSDLSDFRCKEIYTIECSIYRKHVIAEMKS